MSLPKIAVTVPRQRSSFYIDYLQRIRDFGGEPAEVLPGQQHDGSLWAECSGLLLPGGSDIDPARYGAAREPATEESRPELDELEIELVRQAMAHGLPILAICRGHQLLNVAFGGGLHQHIDGDSHRAEEDAEHSSRWHEVTIERDGRLGRLIGGGLHRVNSRHHQAVLPSTIAAELRAIAFSSDGFVEATESRDGAWLLSVQWHPERVEMREQSAPLFDDFIQAARGVGPTTRRTVLSV